MNFGVPGYGNVQSYLQLKRQISRGNIPKLAVLGYAGFHNERNVLSPAYRKHLHIGFEESDPELRDHMATAGFPFAQLQDTGLSIQSVPWAEVYEGWPGRKQLALVNALQNLAESRTADHQNPEAVSLRLLEAIQKLCQSHQIPFVIMGLTYDLDTKIMMKRFHEAGLLTLDATVDLSNPDFTHAPYDTHPNEKAHAHYANTLLNFLLRKRLVQPQNPL